MHVFQVKAKFKVTKGTVHFLDCWAEISYSEPYLRQNVPHFPNVLWFWFILQVNAKWNFDSQHQVWCNVSLGRYEKDFVRNASVSRKPVKFFEDRVDMIKLLQPCQILHTQHQCSCRKFTRVEHILPCVNIHCNILGHRLCVESINQPLDVFLITL